MVDTRAGAAETTPVSGNIADAVTFREVMRHHATTVTIISPGSFGQRRGLTATSVCSLSDAPPLVLVCVNRSASGHEAIRDSNAFCMNILRSDKQEIAARFAGRCGVDGEERFAGADWTTIATGAPALKGALANVDCDLVAEHAYETHSIFIGRVRALCLSRRTEPLLYFDGLFRTLRPT